ncbi:MAG: hypothetical protein IKH44_15950 [Bacteroidales bacterium]|jgi:hypothetical protein|nr:hypothetical protein [Bacteroidales bacterium]
MAIKVMISSTVYNFEDQLDQIEAVLKSLGYDTILSKNGSVFADPRYGNFKKSNKENKEMRSIQGKNSNFAALRWQAATLQGVF